jgi:hypothetical protein
MVRMEFAARYCAASPRNQWCERTKFAYKTQSMFASREKTAHYHLLTTTY